MKRSDIKIENKHIIAYCKKENKFQQKVYERKVQLKTMSELEANRNFLIIREFSELVEALQERQIQWRELRKMVKALPARKNVQGKIQFPS